MTPEEILYRTGNNRLTFAQDGVPEKMVVYECMVYDGGTHITPPKVLHFEHLEDWLNQTGPFSIPSPLLSSGLTTGFRLIFQPWMQETSIVAKEDNVLPLGSLKIVEQIWNAWDLPRSYTHDFVRRQPIPLRIKNSANRRKTSIVLQGPDFDTSFTSLTLMHDADTRMTTAYLGFRLNEGDGGPIKPLLSYLVEAGTAACHPLYLPGLIYGLYCDELRRAVKDVNIQMAAIQRWTGRMRKYLDPDDSMSDDLNEHLGNVNRRTPMAFDTTHSQLVVLHAAMTNGLSDFVARLRTNFPRALKRFQNQTKRIPTAALDMQATHEDLQAYCEHLGVTVDVELDHRDQMLSRIDMQLRVLYNDMQQRIATETLRDSSAMKSIALLTMIFLPTTALAAIFSMSSFFDNKASGIKVSSRFWIFWTISIPMTLGIMLVWFCWIQRKELRSWLRGFQPHKESNSLEADVEEEPKAYFAPAGSSRLWDNLAEP